MKVAAGIAAVAADRAPGGLAVAIGNFDGVHLGHRRLLDEARARAAAHGARAAVLTFTPHPAKLFAPDRAPPLILSLERRLELCAAAGIELAIVEPFTRQLAAIEADDFVKQALARDLGARDVIVGYDFSFGRGRAGDTRRLAALGDALGIGVAVIPQVTVDGVACSSTKIRELVTAGRTREAARLLGRPYELEGPVVRGAGRGRALGFPTANVAADAELRPALGIYAARALILDGPAAGAARPAALSVGRNPTFTGPGAAVSVEAFLLDWDGDLYDRRLRLEVGERLRDEQKFDSVAALVAQIDRDVARVRELSSAS
jgi:riboflavin kinase/FMN adenylyltransferase